METPKTIDTLVEDIYDLFREPHKVSEENLEEFGEAVKAAVKLKIEEATSEYNPEKSLRMSQVGKPNRRLWFELKDKEERPPLSPSTFIKFIYGDIIEHLIILLTKEAGHKVGHEQEEVEINGVLGHTDGTVDNTTVDYKSASSFQFRQKWSTRALMKPGLENDPFGYKGQIAGYYDEMVKKYPEINKEHVAWVVMDKESGELMVVKVDVMDLPDVKTKITTVKEELKKDTPPPEKCFSDKEDGKSGNRVLHNNCTYCPHKFKCWSDANQGRGLRVFKYANGKRYLTNVGSLPKVEEVTLDVET